MFEHRQLMMELLYKYNEALISYRKDHIKPRKIDQDSKIGLRADRS